MEYFPLEIITPKGVVVSQRVHEVTFPGADGEVGVLPGHAAYTGLVRPGVLSYKVEAQDKPALLVVHAGSAEVTPEGKMRILIDEVEIPAGDLGFIGQRLVELREITEKDEGISIDEKVLLLVEAYTEIEQRYSRNN